MAGTRFQKFLLIFGCTLALLTFQNCSQNFESFSSVNSNSVEDENAIEDNNEPPANDGDDESSVTPPTTTQPTIPPPVSPPPTEPPPSSGMVSVFMATGHVGRTVFSCDDGRTWIHDRSDNDNTRCWVDGNPNYVECDHTVNSGRGIDIEGGYIFANFGWGYNGSIRRSRDGANWEVMRTDGWGGGIGISEDGHLFVTWNYGMSSSNLGATWQVMNSRPVSGLDAPFVKRVGNKMAMIGRPSGANKISLSLDGGRTWFLPAALQSATWIKNIEEGSNGRLVLIGNANNVAYSAISDNNGTSWTIRQQSALSAAWDNVFFDGQKFVSFANGRRWISTNGLDWTSEAFTVSGISASSFAGPIALDPTTGTYVRILDIWGNYYDRQRAYRSTDGGLTWQVLSSTAFRGGHPIRDIKYGEIEASFCR